MISANETDDAERQARTRLGNRGDELSLLVEGLTPPCHSLLRLEIAPVIEYAGVSTHTAKQIIQAPVRGVQRKQLENDDFEPRPYVFGKVKSSPEFEIECPQQIVRIQVRDFAFALGQFRYS